MEKKNNIGDIEINHGSSLWGFGSCFYGSSVHYRVSDILELLGEPCNSEFPNIPYLPNTNYFWECRLNGTTYFSISDMSLMDKSDIDAFCDWQINGFSENDTETVRKYLIEILG